jgi:hypothetical protein
MATQAANVPSLSGVAELIDSRQLAERWRVPESWIRTRSGSRTPKEDRIPCVHLGRYIRFRPGPELDAWLAKQCR